MIRPKTPPKYTIITVVHNDKSKIEATLLSVINQTYKPKEYIVIDGGSTDGTLDIIRKHDARISAYISEKDNGMYDAMNKGIRKATGEWILFLNSGDLFVDNTIVEKVAAAIKQFPEKPEIVYGNILTRNDDGTYRETIAAEPHNSHQMYFRYQSAFVRLPLLRKYTFDKKHTMSADLKFFKRCYYNKHIFQHLQFPISIYDYSRISHAERIRCLQDNIAIIKEMDKGRIRTCFLIRLYAQICWQKLICRK